MKHTCGGTEMRTSRVLLALLSDDSVSYRVVVDEVGTCVHCWTAICHWLLALVAGRDALQAGSVEAAADLVLQDIDRVLTITNAPW